MDDPPGIDVLVDLQQPARLSSVCLARTRHRGYIQLPAGRPEYQLSELPGAGCRQWPTGLAGGGPTEWDGTGQRGYGDPGLSGCAEGAADDLQLFDPGAEWTVPTGGARPGQRSGTLAHGDRSG